MSHKSAFRELQDAVQDAYARGRAEALEEVSTLLATESDRLFEIAQMSVNQGSREEYRTKCATLQTAVKMIAGLAAADFVGEEERAGE